jgi:hypothetical protein
MSLSKLLLISISFIFFHSCVNPTTPEEITAEDIQGTWLNQYPYYPDTGSLLFNANGSYEQYSDYDQAIPVTSGTWNFDGTNVTIDAGSTIVLEVRDANDSELILYDSNMDIVYTFYKWQAYPTGSAFAGATTLSIDADHTITFPVQTSQHFVFNVSDGLDYTISCDQFGGSGSFDGSVDMNAYDGNLSGTPYFTDADIDQTGTVITSVGDFLYLKVYPHWAGDSVSIRVQQN